MRNVTPCGYRLFTADPSETQHSDEYSSLVLIFKKKREHGSDSSWLIHTTMEYEVKFLSLWFKFLKILFLNDMLTSAAS